jgi:hypothetical protein
LRSDCKPIPISHPVFPLAAAVSRFFAQHTRHRSLECFGNVSRRTTCFVFHGQLTAVLGHVWDLHPSNTTVFAHFIYTNELIFFVFKTKTENAGTKERAIFFLLSQKEEKKTTEKQLYFFSLL